MSPSSFAAEANDLEKWRAERAESLKKNWLPVVGLEWLSEGDNTVGSGEKMKIHLPATAPADFAVIRRTKNQTQIQFNEIKGVTLNDKPLVAKKFYPLVTDKGRKSEHVKVGTIDFNIIDRPNGLGVRIRDENSPTLRDFAGLQWWEPKKEFIITGKWNAFKERVLRVPDILGNSYDEKIKGSVVFEVNGQKVELFPTREKDDLFFVFKDATTGKESYGTGRFLEAQVGKNGEVILDFNRAYNPPCAAIKFATCPIPPAENNLKVAIAAGEKAPLKKH